ncbi:MAG TPA: NAD-dependent deacylase [Verrucomicrobiae bacterium]|jgi:NAD-dependent deacetylase|nr:NAD-dependent deacylase [Verrucomicrobiae bacterium]
MTFPRELLLCLAAARRVTILTGAGVSAESGVPTFRDAQTGLWAKYRAEDLATPRAFRSNPKLVWEWYAWRRELVSKAKPNPAHDTLAAMETYFPEFNLITQNVDGLHQRAGSRKVIELHGNIARTKCFNEGTIISQWPDTGDVPPKCQNCGGPLRPDVVWFEESLPQTEIHAAHLASASCDVFLSIGTSALVYPAAALPLEALQNGALLVEINPQPTPLTKHASFVLSSAAGLALPELFAGIKKLREV